MHGALALSGGVLYVGKDGDRPQVRSYDLDGHPLPTKFEYGPSPGAVSRRAGISGMAVDLDRTLWIADPLGANVRAFSVFGAEGTGFGEACSKADQYGALGRPVDVSAMGEDTEARIIVASGGARRHALQRFDTEGVCELSLRPLGDPEGLFGDLAGIAQFGRYLYACEQTAERVQVFRDDDFHFAFGASGNFTAPFRPRAVAPLHDGRMVVASSGDVEGSSSALLLFDGAGHFLRALAVHGEEEGSVFEPSDLAVLEGEDDAHTRIAVLDRDGERVQIFTLTGRCYGAFVEPTSA